MTETPAWMQEALSYRHSIRAVILVGLEDGTFAVLDEHNPKDRNYWHCESIAHVEQYLVGLRARGLQPPPKPKPTLSDAVALLKELGLE